MAALAIYAVTAALLKDRTDTQAPPPLTRLRRKTPGMIPLTVPEIRRLLAAAFQRPHPARPRHALAELATPSPGPLVPGPPAHPAKSRQCPGHLANGGCRTDDYSKGSVIVADQQALDGLAGSVVVPMAAVRARTQVT